MLLVTGATGYLGSAVVTDLVAAGYDVRATVRDPARASVLPAGVQTVTADLDDADSLVKAMAGCDGVFHLAAAVGHSPDEARRVNVEGTARVLAAARASAVRRVVYTSSSAAIIEADGLVSERAPNTTALLDAYSTTKAQAEGRVFAAVADGLDAVIVNSVNVYGPSPRGPQSYNGLFAAAARGEVPQIVDAPVGWVLAADVAEGHRLAFERGEAGRRYLLCGEVAPFPRVLDAFCALVGSPHRVCALPPGSDLPDGAPLYALRSQVYGKLGPVRIDDAQARALGCAPRGVDEGLAVTAEWMRGGAAAG